MIENHVAEPRVSIIMPTYNRGLMLSRAMESALSQTYSDYELIVVDDGSSEDVASVVSQFADPRITYFRHETNRGQSSAINTGLDLSRGEFIAFLDDDDLWLPFKLEKQVGLLDSSPNEVAMIYAWLEVRDFSSGRLLAVRRKDCDEQQYLRMLALDVPNPTSVFLVRSSVAKEVGGYDPRITTHNDVDFTVRILAQGYRAVLLPEVVVVKHDHDLGRMYTKTPEVLDRSMKYHRLHAGRFADELSKNPRALASLHIRMANISRESGHYPRALALVLKALRISPLTTMGYFLARPAKSLNAIRTALRGRPG